MDTHILPCIMLCCYEVVVVEISTSFVCKKLCCFNSLDNNKKCELILIQSIMLTWAKQEYKGEYLNLSISSKVGRKGITNLNSCQLFCHELGAVHIPRSTGAKEGWYQNLSLCIMFEMER